MNRINDHIDIIKLNPQGQEIWRYPGKIIKRDEKGVLVEAFFNISDRPFHGITLRTDDRSIERYYTDRWYNIFEIHDREDDRLKAWYCNVTTPAEFDVGKISYVDLALDVLVYPNGDYLVLDEDEFAELDLAHECRKKALQGLDSLRILVEKSLLAEELN